jgi:hypothetical protein
MKHIPLLLVLGFALSLCNLTKRLTDSGKSEGSKNATANSASTGAAAERPIPTAAQTAALAGGQTVNWDKQGITLTLPAKWTKQTDETKSFVYSSPGFGASLNINISTMAEDFPTDISINAFYDQAKTRSKNGEVDQLKWLEIDGLKGVEFRESNPEKPDGFRRLQWLAYRKYAGQVQMVNLMLATTGKEYPKYEDAMYGILYSTKIVH